MFQFRCIVPVMLLVGFVVVSGKCHALTLTPIGSYPESPIADWFDEGGAEAVGYDPSSQTIATTNRYTQSVHVISIADPSAPELVVELDVTPYGAEPTNLDVKNGMLAVTVPAETKTDNGVVLLYPLDSVGVVAPAVVEVGPLPDAVKFTPDGRHVVVLNEGEPNDSYTVDPEGSISIIDVGCLSVKTADFKRYNRKKRQLIRQGIRIYGPGASVAMDLEPENLTISDDSKTAWVTLQENNAMAIVSLSCGQVTRLVPLGYKKYFVPGNELDASDKDKAINIQNWPVFGMYQPDGIASFRSHRRTWLVTANEGDAREYVYDAPTGEYDENGDPIMEEVVAFSEEVRVKDVTLIDAYEENWPDIQDKSNLGRLKTTTSPPFGKFVSEEGEDVYGLIYSYGARSFSIWDDKGSLVYDSGADFEWITADALPDSFNANNDENKMDGRSDDKGPEPEGVTVGQIDDRMYAFISLERIGGIMMYDVTTPWNPIFVDYANNRDFEGDPELGEAKDLAPEGLVFIPAEESPTGVPLLAVANEVSGNATIYQITE